MTPIIFTSRRYASELFGIILSVSVRPFVCQKKRNYIETTGRIELVLGMESSFPFPLIQHCVVRTLMYLRKIRVLSSVTLLQTLHLGRVAHVELTARSADRGSTLTGRSTTCRVAHHPVS